VRQASASLSADLAELSMDIAGAWAEEAGVERWNRTVRLERGPNAAVAIEDDWTLRDAPESLVLSLMAAGDVDASMPGQLRLAGPGRSLLVDYDPDAWSASVERIEFVDSRLTPVWGAFVSRVLLTATRLAATGHATLRIHA
jgi:hypothetical protein